MEFYFCGFKAFIKKKEKECENHIPFLMKKIITKILYPL